MAAYVVVAVFCERLLVEKDGTASLIRVIDVIRGTGESATPEPRQDAAIAYPTTFYVSLWADAPAKTTIGVSLEYEGGERLQVAEQIVEFTESRRGQNFAVNFAGFPHLGVLWAEVTLDGVLKTRTPLTLLRDDTPAS